MTEGTKKSIIELYQGAKDKEEQIKLLTKMGFGSRREIIKTLHEADLAMDIEEPKAQGRKPQKDRTVEITKEDSERPPVLPIPADVKQLLIDELEGIDSSIHELDEIISQKQQEKAKLEQLYSNIVKTVNS